MHHGKQAEDAATANAASSTSIPGGLYDGPQGELCPLTRASNADTRVDEPEPRIRRRIHCWECFRLSLGGMLLRWFGYSID